MNIEVDSRSFVKDGENIEVDGGSFVKDGRNIEVDGRNFVKDDNLFVKDGRNIEVDGWRILIDWHKKLPAVREVIIYWKRLLFFFSSFESDLFYLFVLGA